MRDDPGIDLGFVVQVFDGVPTSVLIVGNVAAGIILELLKLSGVNSQILNRTWLRLFVAIYVFWVKPQ